MTPRGPFQPGTFCDSLFGGGQAGDQRPSQHRSPDWRLLAGCSCAGRVGSRHQPSGEQSDHHSTWSRAGSHRASTASAAAGARARRGISDKCSRGAGSRGGEVLTVGWARPAGTGSLLRSVARQRAHVWYLPVYPTRE